MIQIPFFNFDSDEYNKQKNKINFTHVLTPDGWEPTEAPPFHYNNIQEIPYGVGDNSSYCDKFRVFIIESDLGFYIILGVEQEEVRE